MLVPRRSHHRAFRRSSLTHPDSIVGFTMLFCRGSIRTTTRKHWCSRDSSVKSQAERNLADVNSIHSTGRLTLLPSADFRGKHHPPDYRIECKPLSSVLGAPIESHLKVPQCEPSEN